MGSSSGVSGVSGVFGVSGVSGVGRAAAYNNSQVADALIKNKDGISGLFKPDALCPRRPDFDSANNLQRLDPDLRVAVIDGELQNILLFTTSDDEVALSTAADFDSQDPTKCRYSKIVSLSAPDELDIYTEQIKIVETYSDLRTDRAVEILSQVGTMEMFFISILPINPGTAPKFTEFLHAAWRFALLCEMRFKHLLGVPRPITYSSQIQPMILTPAHGSFPSGHATEAYMAAELCSFVLDQVFTDKSSEDYLEELKRQLNAQAARIAINRTVAGVHFPMDSTAGRVLGTSLADIFIAAVTGGEIKLRRTVSGKSMSTRDAKNDFKPNDDIKDPYAKEKRPDFVSVEANTLAAAPINTNALRWLWKQAFSELKAVI